MSESTNVQTRRISYQSLDLTPQLLSKLTLPPNSILKSILPFSEIPDSFHSLSLSIQYEGTILSISSEFNLENPKGTYLNDRLIQWFSCNQHESGLTGRIVGLGKLDTVLAVFGGQD
jgi:hypothetical protein